MNWLVASRGDPPDLLLTTPESLEAMMISPRVSVADLLGGVRAVVVDELHAFAGDDRGWHLLFPSCSAGSSVSPSAICSGSVSRHARRRPPRA